MRSPLPQAPQIFGPSLLAQGRHVYADLQRTRAAALRRRAANLRVALTEARDTLHRLSSSREEAGLRAQMEIIRNDLQDEAKLPDADLWDPVVADLDTVYANAPPQQYSKNLEAARKGRAAAAKGQSKAVEHELEVVLRSRDLGAGVYPLERVFEDIDSALQSADLKTPDWDAALAAIVSALGQIHWLTRNDVLALIQAYNAAVAAYGAWSQQKETAIQYLAKYKQILDRTPGGSALARKANKLIENPELTREDLRALADERQSRIRHRREAEATAYHRGAKGPK
jgi:hypothetical protein